MKAKVFSLLAMLIAVSLHAQVTENFNHMSKASSQSNCWEIPSTSDFGIVSVATQAVNTGADEPMLRTGNISAGSVSFKTPFIKFNGSGVVAFKHRLHSTSAGTSRTMDIKVIDQSGNVVSTAFNYDYLANTPVTDVHAEAVPVSWTGIYQLQFTWTGVGGGARGVIDDISIHGAYAADSSLNNGGVCPAMNVPTDTICTSYADQSYKIYNPVSGSTYNWFLSDPAAGTIDNSITTDNSEIEIDWSGTAGLYTINVYETSSEGCIGDTVQLDVIVDTLPTVAVTVTAVCHGENPTATFTLTGNAPWVLSYTDGTTNYTDTVNSSPYVKVLPAYASSQTLTVTGLTQASACSGDPASLPSVPILINPKPSTGLIFHQ